MPEWCPQCGAYGFAEYHGETHVKKCLKCGYRERVVFTTDKERLKRLIKLHEPDLLAIEAKEKLMETHRCKTCGFMYGTSVGEKPPVHRSCKGAKPHDWEKLEFGKK